MGGGARDGGADRWPLRKQAAAPPTPEESLSCLPGDLPQESWVKRPGHSAKAGESAGSGRGGEGSVEHHDRPDGNGGASHHR